MTTERQRIAILGGGPAGLSAAFHLTDPTLFPDAAERFEITVHQMGWRLGGKGATGRRGTPVPRPGGGWDLEGDARIEEHGIHLFGNMYVNSTRMLQRACEEVEWPPDAPVTTIEESLLPSDYIQLVDWWSRGWHLSPAWLPANPEHPWDPGEVYADPATIVRELLVTMEEILTGRHEPPAAAQAGVHAEAHTARRSWRERLAEAGLVQAVEHLRARHGHDPLADVDGLVDAIAALLEAAAGHVAPDDDGYAHIRSVFTQLEFYGRLLIGALADGVLVDGIDVVDDEDYRHWFTRHGMTAMTLDSNVVQLPVLVCFAFADGDTSAPPTMSASAYLAFILRQVTARGHASYYFATSTGETVIAPVYRTLLQRGVRFAFFHEVTGLEVADGRLVGVDIDVQAETVEGDYDPLVGVQGGPLTGPDRQIYDQLVQGEELAARDVDLESWWADWPAPARTRLVVGEDVDVVISALPLPVLPLVAPDVEAFASWDAALPAVATLAAQLWLDEPPSALGWPELDGTQRVIATGGVAPMGVADFTQSLPWEAWGPDGPAGLLYLCGTFARHGTWPPFDDHAFPGQADAAVRGILLQWLRSAVAVLPDAGGIPTQGGAFDLAHLWCPPEAGEPVGEQRLDAQYWRANIDPNERYHQAPPGSAAVRPQAWESGIGGLALAGDWIFTGWNVPSFEAAVMSGALASLAVAGKPALDDIPGYGFLRRLPTPPPPLLPPPDA